MSEGAPSKKIERVSPPGGIAQSIETVAETNASDQAKQLPKTESATEHILKGYGLEDAAIRGFFSRGWELRDELQGLRGVATSEGITWPPEEGSAMAERLEIMWKIATVGTQTLRTVVERRSVDNYRGPVTNPAYPTPPQITSGKRYEMGHHH